MTGQVPRMAQNGEREKEDEFGIEPIASVTGRRAEAAVPSDSEISSVVRHDRRLLVFKILTNANAAF